MADRCPGNAFDYAVAPVMSEASANSSQLTGPAILQLVDSVTPAREGNVMLHYGGRVALVTGAGQGLGREYGLLLASRGARVLVNDYGHSNNRYSADDVVDEIVAAGGTAIADHESVATPAGGESIVEHTMDAFGQLDILINNAGIVRDRAFHNLSEDQITEVLDVHLNGAFWVTRPAYKIMRDASYGRVVFTTSLSGLLGNFGQANYAAAKAGVVGLAKVIATEGSARGIRSNVIAPLAQTEMAEQLTGFDIGGFRARDVAAVVGFLAHEECAVSGEIFSAVGGRVARYFIGLTRGMYRPGLTPEDVADNVSEISDTTGFVEPRMLSDEIDCVIALVKGAT
jgi:NAD(P)-dependent dehydrogenase (short-subunit alcohol dehydrogenase family)